MQQQTIEAPVSCFTRAEHNGIRVLFPIEGRMKQNCLLVNEAVEFTYEQLVQRVTLAELRDAFAARAEAQYTRDLAQWEDERRQRDLAAAGSGNGSASRAGTLADEEPPRPPLPDKVHFDLYRILVMLKDHEICRYADSELIELLPQGRELRGATQLMSVASIQKTSEFLQASLDPDSDVVPFYTLPRRERLDPAYFDVAGVARRHLNQQHVYFVHLDKRGRVQVCSLLAGFASQPASLRIGYVAARADSPEGYEDAVGSHLSSLCGLLSVTALSPMVRIQIPTGQHPDVTLHASFYDLIAELGFRRSFDLPDELGREAGLVGYDKVLF